MASAKSKASEQELALKSAKEKVQSLLADYQTNAKQEEEQKQAYQSQQNQLFDRLDNLKNKQAKAQSLENILKNHSNFLCRCQECSPRKKSLRWYYWSS